MIPLDALIVPDTEILTDRLVPLTLCFSPLHYLRLVEPEEQHSGPREPDLFMEAGLCQAHTPAPLAENRSRFLQLVKDIAERKDDYAAQLSALTMAAMSGKQLKGEGENRSEIVSSLFRRHHLPEGKGTGDSPDLWQARLILAIGEILDREEAEIHRQLRLLDDRELEMLQQLRGREGSDSDDPFAGLEAIRQRLAASRPRELKIRFEAWRRLMDDSPLLHTAIWLATSVDSADQVITAYEKHRSVSSRAVLKLPLPAAIPVSTAHQVAQVGGFRRDAAACLERLAGELGGLATSADYDPSDPAYLLPLADNWTEQWEYLLQRHFPDHSHGRSELTIRLLQDQPIGRLFATSPAPPPAEKLRHGILAILENPYQG